MPLRKNKNLWRDNLTEEEKKEAEKKLAVWLEKIHEEAIETMSK